MSDEEMLHKGRMTRAVTGGGHPVSEERGRVPSSSTDEPSQGPTSPGGAGSANTQSNPTSDDS
ncbi:hypothetical protein GCM10017786_13060 [Amycolatopsis deserti]|uniref:Uncharacterized protein n=1 Tax=Amycolatopsis deserti TaxID=185696 RepID=A0ABQ3IG46_9PSEU|nr:hypothetical protein [Amycolatopsis deserti]GHE83370.1 hypothetical protein GCM10017786_13060 [Amycolatopsis deserti]